MKGKVGKSIIKLPGKWKIWLRTMPQCIDWGRCGDIDYLFTNQKKKKKWKMKKGQSDVANVFNIVRFIDSSIFYYVNNFIFFLWQNNWQKLTYIIVCRLTIGEFESIVKQDRGKFRKTSNGSDDREDGQQCIPSNE